MYQHATDKPISDNASKSPLTMLTVASCLGLMLSIGPVAGQSRPDEPLTRRAKESTFSIVIENDDLAGTDRNYTNGVRLSWLSGARPADRWARFLAERVLRLDDDFVTHRGISMGHSIFTPRNTEATELLPNQHPYAGWLYGDYTTLISTEDSLHRVTLTTGLVGPNAGGEWVQNEFHSLIGAEESQGWDNQIGNEVGFNVAYDRMLRSRWSSPDGVAGLGWDLTPSYGFSAGNIHTNAYVGATVRLGKNLQRDFGPPRIRPALAGAGNFNAGGRLTWYFFAGVQGRVVAHNIFLDGGLFDDDDPNVSSKTFVSDYQVGGVVSYGSVQLALSLIHRSDEFESQAQAQQFGALSLSIKY